MRIAMFMPELVPGALGSLVYRDLARAIAARGHSFECLGIRAGTDPADAWIGTLPLSDRWQALGALGAPFLRHRRLPAYVAALARWLRGAGRGVDVLHVEIAYPTGAAVALAAAWAGWRGVLSVTPMGEDVLVVEDTAYGYRRHAVPRALVGWTLRRAAIVRCISPLVERLVAREWPGVPTRTIPLNVAAKAVAFLDEPPERRQAERSRARRALEERWGLGGDRVVLALGRLHPFKGIDVLVEAMASVPGARLLVAGPSLDVRPFGDTGTRLAARARARGVADRVHFLGAVPPADALDLLGGADVVAVPSHLESLNKVCVEAAAAGTPFVATETTGVTGWIPGPGVGLVVPPRDPAALAAALREVLGGGWRPDRDAVRAFVGRFATERVAAELVELYASLRA